MLHRQMRDLCAGLYPALLFFANYYVTFNYKEELLEQRSTSSNTKVGKILTVVSDVRAGNGPVQAPGTCLCTYIFQFISLCAPVLAPC